MPSRRDRSRRRCGHNVVIQDCDVCGSLCIDHGVVKWNCEHCKFTLPEYQYHGYRCRKMPNSDRCLLRKDHVLSGAPLSTAASHGPICVPVEDSTYWMTKRPFLVGVAKTGCCSLIFSVPVLKDSLWHLKAKYYPRNVRHNMYAFVRCPFDRLVSAYLFNHRGGFFDWEVTRALKQLTWRQFVMEWLSPALIQQSCQSIMTQSVMLCDDDGDLIVPPDNIGHFEQLCEYTRRFFGHDLTAHYNKSTDRVALDDYYKDDDIKQRVRQLYKQDFDLIQHIKEAQGLRGGKLKPRGGVEESEENS